MENIKLIFIIIFNIFIIFYLSVSIPALFYYKEKNVCPKMFITKNWVLITGGICILLSIMLSLGFFIQNIEKNNPKPEYKLINKNLYEKVK